MLHIMKVVKILTYSIVLIFAGLGIAVTAVFIGMQYGLLNVRGSIEERNASFGPLPTLTKQIQNSLSPFSSTSTPTQAQTTGSTTEDTITSTESCVSGQTKCEWNETTQWIVVRDALIKDKPIIDRVSTETGVPSRMIASAIVPEQIRFFTSNREVFKRYFEPLKLLVSLSKFSLGVSGIKQDTAAQIETYAQAPDSIFYPGVGIADRLVYADGTDHDQELFNRLTDAKDHYYSYLYTAVFLKEIQAQWATAGFDVQNRPDVLVTLFNLGFSASKPNPEPKVAGSVIELGGQNYTFGYLGTTFYHSNELLDIFPR